MNSKTKKKNVYHILQSYGILPQKQQLQKVDDRQEEKGEEEQDVFVAANHPENQSFNNNDTTTSTTHSDTKMMIDTLYRLFHTTNHHNNTTTTISSIITIEQCTKAIQMAQKQIQKDDDDDFDDFDYHNPFNEDCDQQQDEEEEEDSFNNAVSSSVPPSYSNRHSASSTQQQQHPPYVQLLLTKCTPRSSFSSQSQQQQQQIPLLAHLPTSFTLAFFDLLTCTILGSYSTTTATTASSYSYNVTRLAYQLDQYYMSMKTMEQQQKQQQQQKNQSHPNNNTNTVHLSSLSTDTKPPPLLALSTMLDLWEYVVRQVVIVTAATAAAVVVQRTSNIIPSNTNNNSTTNTTKSDTTTTTTYSDYPYHHLLVSPIATMIGLFSHAGINTPCWYRIYTLITTTTMTVTFSVQPPNPSLSLLLQANATTTTASSGTSTTTTTTQLLPIPIWVRMTLIRAMTIAAATTTTSSMVTTSSSYYSAILDDSNRSKRRISPSSTANIGSGGSTSRRSNNSGHLQLQQQQHHPNPHSTTSSTTTMTTNQPISKDYFAFSPSHGGGCNGLQRTINSLNVWPFRNDFGMAVWFRIEGSYNHNHSKSSSHQQYPIQPTQHPILLSIRSENGGGIVVSIIPIEKESSTTTTSEKNTAPSSTDAYTIVISIYNSTLDHTNHIPSHQIVTSKYGIVLLSHIWYHISIRHTRSRMKGVFSLSSQETITILLDGKVICTETLPFPNISSDGSTYYGMMNDTNSNTNSSNNNNKLLLLRRTATSHSSMNVVISFGTNFIGQTGALYIFNDNVSDATFRALYEITGGLIGGNKVGSKASFKRSGGSSSRSLNQNIDTWDAKRNDMIRKSRVLDINMKADDVEEIVLSQRRTAAFQKQRVINKILKVLDLADGDDHHHHTNDTEIQEYPIHLQKSAFASKIFLAWDPHRTLDNTLALELHIGAHVNMSNVYAWGYSCVRDVIGSTGGIQSIIPLIRSFLSCDIETWDMTNSVNSTGLEEPRYEVMMAIPNLIRLLVAFIQDHNDNARELLRCGGIDVLEHMLLTCKKKSPHTTNANRPSSLFAILNIYPAIAQELIDALIELRAACSNFVSLESKVYSRLLFNIPLWLSGFVQLPGAALHTELLQVLSIMTRSKPEKVRDCVGVRDMVMILKEYVSAASPVANTTHEPPIDRFTNIAKNGLSKSLSTVERRHASKILLAMIFTVMATGTNYQSLSSFLDLVSYTLDVQFGVNNSQSESNKSEWKMFAFDLCSTLLLLLQLRPAVDGLYENFAQACGGVQGGASWILLAMVNVPDDEIRSIGIRCISSYLDITNRGPDTPLTLGSTVVKQLSTNHDTVRRASTRISQIAKGFTSGSQSYRPVAPQIPRITARVVYKLLWHLLKSNPSKLGDYTEFALLDWITNDDEMTTSSLSNLNYIVSNMKTSYESKPHTLSVNSEWIKMIFAKGANYNGKLLCNPLAIGTVLRLLRFLNNDRKDRWLSVFLCLTKTSRKCVSTLATLPEWQPCLFHLISESLELLQTDPIAFGNEDFAGILSPEIPDAQLNRLDLCLQLYSTLLGYLLRSGGDRSLEAVERVAALQRMALNGNHVLILVLSSLCGNIFENGTLLDVGSISAQDWQEIDLDIESLLLKQSAKLITDAILSKGTKGLDLTVAVRSWRSIRHLTEVIAALVTKCGLGIVDLFDYVNYQASSLDSISKGLHGIRLSDSYVNGVTATEYALFIDYRLRTCVDEKKNKEVDRRLCVSLSAQILTLLDAFIFPDSLNTAVPGTQVDGLALVRFSEARLGASQGPLISSAIRLSVLLLSLVEPCSVAYLQCVSRLRCLLCWALELLREQSVADAQSIHFHIDGDAHMNRLILAITLHCHRALGRCSALLWEIESTSPEKYFHSKDAQKKYHRRLLRVALELRDVVSTAYRGRNNILRTTMSTEAYEALRSSLEGDSSAAKTSKETVIREFLTSTWVTGFTDTVNRHDHAVPEQVSMETIPLSSDQALNPFSQGYFAIEQLAQESRRVVTDFENAINNCFEEYLQAQRIWAETDAVRDLEYDGDTTATRLSENHKYDVIEFSKSSILRKNLAEGRRRAIESKSLEPFTNAKYWKLAQYTDVLGRRSVLVRNRDFNDHAEASYELAIGKEQEKEEMERQKRLLAKKDLADVMRRNAAAFVVDDTLSVSSKDDGSSQHISDGDSTADMESSTDGDSIENAEAALMQEVLLQESIPNEEQDEGWDKVENEEIVDVDVEGGTDAWAKAFIWADSESIVARFEPVMIVSLESFVEGKLLLTTHGLYFHQLGDEINAITREPISTTVEFNESDSKDRRWRLARLTEVHGRRFMLRPQALELFFSDNHELLLNFSNGVKDRDRFHSKLRHSCKVPMLWSLKSLSPRVIFQKSKFTELWKQRKLSNFGYLMALNRMAGRSFNDLTQYPVFPWVIADYISETIDLKDSRTYRDLSKPIGALNSDRLEQLLERYNELELFGFVEAEKFLYGSHYSSPGIVLHYLIRQEPFTTMAIDLQSGRFDCADRLFFNMADSWKSCLTSTSDVKELIPEFFCLPEILLNTNKFPLGRSQNGILVDDVVLPPWAKGSPYEFVRIHRLALESDYVSENLHHWVDLIFGYKQRGPRAIDSHNIFHHLSYEGSVDLTKITDEVDRNAAETHIQNFGQTPSQLLLDEPHPQRYSRENCWKPLLTLNSSEKNFRCYTPTNQYPNKRGEHARGSVLKLHIFSDFVTAVYADLTLGVYRWFPCNKANRLRTDKVRLFARRELSTSRVAIKRGSTVSPDQMDKSKRFAVGNWSVGITLGGFAKEVLRRNALLSSGRLMSGNDLSLSAAESSAIIISCGYWDEALKAHTIDGSRVIASENGGHRGTINCLAISQDGALMVTGGHDGTVRVWVVDHPDMSIALSDGYVQTALGGSIENEVLSCCHCLWGHTSAVTCLDLDANIDAVVSGSESGLVCIHTLRRGEFIRFFHPPAISKYESAGAVNRIAMGTEGNIVIQMEDKGLHTFTVNAVRLCSINAGEILHDMKMCSMDEVVITGGDRCVVQFRQVHNLQILTSIDLSRHGPIRCLASTSNDMNPMEQCLFVGSDDGMISIIDEDPVHLRKDDSTTSF